MIDSAPTRRRGGRRMLLAAVAIAAVCLAALLYFRQSQLPRPHLESLADGSVTLSWQGAVPDRRWALQRADADLGGQFLDLATLEPGRTGYRDSSTLPNTRYRYRLVERAEAGPAASSEELAILTLPPRPEELRVDPVAPNRVNLAWRPAGRKALGYSIERAEGEGEFKEIGKVDLTGYSDGDGLLPDTVYQYRIRASNESGFSEYSKTAGAVTPPDTPSGLRAGVFSDSVVGLAWRPLPATSTVTIERKEGEGHFQPIATVSNDFSYRDRGVSPSTLYVYRIAVAGVDGKRFHSDETTVLTAPAPPAGLTVNSPHTTEIELAWARPDSSVTTVRVERRENFGDFLLVAEVAPPEQAYLDTELDPNATYSYRLQAVNPGGRSDYSSPLKATTLPEKPLDVRAEALEANRVHLTWFSPDGLPVPMQVERQKGVGGPLTVVRTAPGQSDFVDRGVTPNTVYLYRVRAVNEAGLSDFSEPLRLLTLPEPPRRLGVEPTSPTRVQLSWQAPSSPPAPVVIERSDGSGPFVEVATLDDRSFTYADEGLQPNAFYLYRLHAANQTGASEHSPEVEVITYPRAPEEVIAGLSATGEVEVRWECPDEVDGFEVERDEGDGVWRRVHSARGGQMNWLDRTLRPNTYYQYRVRALNGAGGSEYSERIEALTPPSSPSLVEAVALSPFHVQLTWRDGPGNPAPVRIERRGRRGAFEEVAWVEAGSSQYLDSGLVSERVYEYRIAAANDSGFSDFSNPIQVATPPIPWPARIRLTEPRVEAGGEVAAVLILSRPAPPGGWTVRLVSSDPRLADVPERLDFGPGEERKRFVIGTSKRPREPVQVRITAESGGQSVTAELTVEPRP